MSALMMSGKALSAPHHMRSTLTSTSACYSGDYRSRKVSFQSRGSQCRKATIVRKGFPWEISGAEAAVQERLCFKPSEMVDVGPFKVSPMGFGTWAWGNKFLWDYDTKMDPELQEMFNLVVSKGINLFDTADSYGTGQLNGRSEILLGRFMREYPGSGKFKDNVRIATKFAAYPWRVFPDCYDQGLIKGVGVSNYGPKQLKRTVKNLAKRGVPLNTAQVQFSLLSFGKQQEDLLAVSKELGVSVIAYSPLGLGMLTGKYSMDNLPKGPRGSLIRQILPKIEPLLATLDVVAKERKKSMSQVAINWCMRKGTIPIPGAKNVAQTKENLDSLGWALRESEVAELEASVEKSQGKMIQNIFQTQ